MNYMSIASKISALSPEDQLDKLFTLDRDVLRLDALTRYNKLAGPDPEAIVLVGAGPLGRRAVQGLREVGIEPLAFSDNNKKLWYNRVAGVSVLPPQEAAAQYRDSATFVVTIYNGSPIRRQFSELGCRFVVSYAPLFWKYHSVFIPFCNLNLPQTILEHEEDVRRGFMLWSDEQSRREYAAQFWWMVTLEHSILSPPEPREDTYYPGDLFIHRAGEVIVDCGAFDGDSLRDYLSRWGADFSQYVAIEADPDNYSRLLSCIAQLPEKVQTRCRALPYAVGKDRCRVSFSATGTVSSTVTNNGDAAVEMRPLPDLLDCKPGYIKMDIEGGESDALRGGMQLIREAMPVLAISAYHLLEDLWRLPQIIHEISPDYKLYLRRYAEDCWELVCYGIPPAHPC